MEDNLLNGYVNLQRFWAKVKKTDSCWLWTSRALCGGDVKYGLAAIRVLSPRGIATRLEASHRISYELANGPIEPGLHVLHSCDNGLCVNPAHLRTGTREENERDKQLRGRHPHGGRVPDVMLPRASLPSHSGEHHWCAKLTDAQVVEIRTEYANNHAVTLNDLARRFGVSGPLIKMIVTGRERRRNGGPISTIRPIIGARVSGAKLTAEKVADLRARYDAGATIYELGTQFDISPKTVSNIVRGKTWKHVAPAATPVLPGHKHLTRRQVTTIRQRKAKGVSQIQLASDYDVSPGTISLLVRGLTHPTPPPAPR